MIVLAMRDTAPAAPNPAGGGAAGAGPGAVGTVFPDITLTTVDGARASTTSLAGKPVLVWFTDSSCPDASGVARTAALDDELGGQAFAVVAVLVNLRQPGPAQRAWRDAFGRPDWIVTPDQGGSLSTKVGLRALETKFLLDQHGTVLNITTAEVTDEYVNLLRNKAKAAY